MSGKLLVADILEKELVQKCNACLHFMNCSLRLGSAKQIIQCDYFEDAHTKPSKAPHSNHEDVDEIISKGLCSNCVKVKHCGLPKCLSGVWHCEEYE